VVKKRRSTGSDGARVVKPRGRNGVRDRGRAVRPRADGARHLNRRFDKPAATARLRDWIEPGVRVMFVGINPGLRSAETGHHFAGYSNRFWKLLFESGLVPERITYADDWRLPHWGFGITNIVPRATAGIDELTRDEYRTGAGELIDKIRRYRPQTVALVGVTVWRALLDVLGEKQLRREAVTLGIQRLTIEGTQVVVLPNPSGRNATVSYEEMLAAFRVLATESR
jgi:TDG/mug DNA glycosylase family protein